GHVPVRAHHDVAGVVRVQVHHRVHEFPPRDDQALGVVELRDPAERALFGTIGSRPVLALDVGHAMRAPQPLQPVGHARPIALHPHARPPPPRTHLGGTQKPPGHGAGPARQPRRGPPPPFPPRPPPPPPAPLFFSPPRRNGRPPPPAATSSSPASSMYGTFCR